MKVVVFGASGKTGKLVTEQALAAGHTVWAFVHDASHAPAGSLPIVGDVNDAAAVLQAVAGKDAVIDTIGNKVPYRISELESTAARNIIAAMHAQGVPRLIVVSMLGIGDSKAETPWWYEHLVQPTFLRGADHDKTGMEAEVKSSGLDFVIARPPVLSDDPATGSWRIVAGEEKAHSITRADLAEFLVEQLTTDGFLGRAVVVANK